MRASSRTGARAQRGFTLVELMVVVCIIGVLVSVAYPSYAAATLRARKSERDVVVTSIVRSAQNLVVRAGRYPTPGAFAAGWNPPLPVSTHRRTFDHAIAGWRELDVALEGTLYYAYLVVGEQAGGVPASLEVTALGDLDGDGVAQTRTVEYVARNGVFVHSATAFDPPGDLAF
jgi:prepilin-type N-terminal cleavage/methylation domain-containing protein